MKKYLTTSLIALALVSTSVSANAATAAPTIKKPATKATEGTAAHESSETGTTQKKEAIATNKPAVAKKPAGKPAVAKKPAGKPAVAKKPAVKKTK